MRMLDLDREQGVRVLQLYLSPAEAAGLHQALGELVVDASGTIVVTCSPRTCHASCRGRSSRRRSWLDAAIPRSSDGPFI